MDLRQLLAGWAAALAATLPLRAQESGPATDTLLARLTVEAIAANPGLAQLGARARAAAERVRPAGALPDPALSLMVMDLTLPHFRFRESDFTEVDLEARQGFPWPGTQRARQRAALARSEEVGADLAARRRDVVVSMAALYYRLGAVIAAREILALQQELLDGALEIAVARYASGSVPQSDPIAARTARARLTSERAVFEGEERALRVRLAALRGKIGIDSLPVLPLQPGEVLARYPSLEAHPHGGIESLNQHPLARAKRAAIASAEETAKAEGLGAWPDVEIMARYGMRPIATDFFTAGIGLRVPLWAGRKQKLLAEAARQEAVAERAALVETQTNLAAEFEAVLADARAGLERLRVLVAEVIPAADAEREAALRSYRVGQREFQAVLSAEQGLYQARLEAAEVAAEHLISLVRLEQLTRGEESP